VIWKNIRIDSITYARLQLLRRTLEARMLVDPALADRMGKKDRIALGDAIIYLLGQEPSIPPPERAPRTSSRVQKPAG
jgi:hypothetical protein